MAKRRGDIRAYSYSGLITVSSFNIAATVLAIGDCGGPTFITEFFVMLGKFLRRRVYNMPF